MKNKNIVKSILGSVILAISVGVAQGAVIVSDSFTTGGIDYAAGNLTGQGPVVAGMNGNWINNSGTSSHTVNETGLTYNDSGYVNGGGGGVSANVNGFRTGRLLDTAYTDASVGTVYMSFLMQMDTVDSSQYRAFELHDGGFSDSANRMFQLGSHKNDMTTTNFGYRLRNSASWKGELDTLNTNVNLFVVKFEFSDVANSDSVTVWQNPTLGGAGDPAGGVTLSGYDMSFDRITLARYNSNAGLSWDEIRMGDTFTDVIPEPATLGLIAVFGGGLVAVRRFFSM